MCDADLSTTALRFLNEVFNKKIVVYENKYVEDINIITGFHSRYNSFVREVVKVMKRGELVYVCSDSLSELNSLYADIALSLHAPNDMKRDMKEEEKEKIMDECRKKMDEVSLIYTSKGGNKEDFANIDKKWRNMNVFCSPTVQYGLSYDELNTHHTFSYCYRNTATAFDNVQQAYRIRHPISFHVYIHKGKPKKETQNDSDEEQNDKEIKEIEKAINKMKNKDSFYVNTNYYFQKFSEDYIKYNLKDEHPIYKKLYDLYLKLKYNSPTDDEELLKIFINYRIFNRIDNLKYKDRELVYKTLLRQKGHKNIVNLDSIIDVNCDIQNIESKIGENSKLLNSIPHNFDESRLKEILEIIIKYNENNEQCKTKIDEKINELKDNLMHVDNEEMRTNIEHTILELQTKKMPDIRLDDLKCDHMIGIIDMHEEQFYKVRYRLCTLLHRFESLYPIDFLLYCCRIHELNNNISINDAIIMYIKQTKQEEYELNNNCNIKDFYYFVLNFDMCKLLNDSMWEFIIGMQYMISLKNDFNKNVNMEGTINIKEALIYANNDGTQTDQIKSKENRTYLFLQLHKMIFENGLNFLNYDIIRDVLRNQQYPNITYSDDDVNVMLHISDVFNLHTKTKNNTHEKNIKIYNEILKSGCENIHKYHSECIGISTQDNVSYISAFDEQRGVDISERKKYDTNTNNQYQNYLNILLNNNDGISIFYEVYKLMNDILIKLFKPIVDKVRYRKKIDNKEIDREYNIINEDELNKYVTLLEIKKINEEINKKNMEINLKLLEEIKK